MLGFAPLSSVPISALPAVTPPAPRAIITQSETIAPQIEE